MVNGEGWRSYTNALKRGEFPVRKKLIAVGNGDGSEILYKPIRSPYFSLILDGEYYSPNEVIGRSKSWRLVDSR